MNSKENRTCVFSDMVSFAQTPSKQHKTWICLILQFVVLSCHYIFVCIFDKKTLGSLLDNKYSFLIKLFEWRGPNTPVCCFITKYKRLSRLKVSPWILRIKISFKMNSTNNFFC